MKDIQSDKNGQDKEYKDAMSGVERALKRMIDFTISLCGIIVLLPVYVLIYIVVLVFSGGEVIYKQERIGYKGKPFTIYKFRTMKRDAEKNGIPRTEEERRGQMTGVGAFLRDHHLDELPQLFNVLLGDMSFVGPRPERQVFIDKIMEVAPHYVHVYKMRPGLTSTATLYNGYTDTMEKMLVRLEMDLAYYRERSWLLDIKLLALTFFSIIFGKKF